MLKSDEKNNVMFIDSLNHFSKRKTIKIIFLRIVLNLYNKHVYSCGHIGRLVTLVQLYTMQKA